jgi:type II secretion system protein G
MMYYSSTQKGFTLIELLVVIAIIGLLSSVVLASVSAAREKSRDARRLSDMRQIQQALEMYYDDHNEYPNEDGSGWETSLEDDGEFLEVLVDEGYLPSYIIDPINSGGNYYSYFKYSAGTNGCTSSKGQFYILGVANIEGADESYTALDDGTIRVVSDASPGWHCPESTGATRDWQDEFDWVTGASEY